MVGSMTDDDTVPRSSQQNIVQILENTRKRICVYCGHRSGLYPDYVNAAEEVGKELVSRGIGLVYGGGSVGMMGVLSRAVEEGGGEVVGVIPEALTAIELSGPMVGTTIVVRTMHERKAKMASLADCFIALPGGYGTLEELMEVLTWSNVGIHSKPVGVLNVGNYYDPLLQMFDRMVTAGFLLQAQRDILICEPTPSRLIDRLLLRGIETARDGQPPLPTRPILPSGESLGGGGNDGNDVRKGTH